MAGYTRTDTTNNIADGNIINATDLDNEFDGIQAAFNSSTGHNHDGTTGEGAPILVLGPTQDVVVGATTVTPKTTNTVDIGSSSLKFKDLHMAGNALIGGTLGVTGIATFTAQPVLSSLTASRAVFTDGSKGLVSNTITGTGNVVMSASPTLTGTIGGENATLSGTLAVTGVATFTAQPIVSSLTASRAVFSDGSKGLVSNAITGTGNVVMSASPTLTGTVVVADLTDSSLTAGRVTYAGTGGNLVDSTNLTFNGTTLSAAGLSDSGNLAFTGTGNRITGDFSNATIASRVAIQSSTVNGNTEVFAIPNGTGAQAAFRLSNTSDITNNSGISMIATATEARLAASNAGTGTVLPLTFYTGGSERLRIDTSGNVGIGTSSPDQTFGNRKLTVATGIGIDGTSRRWYLDATKQSDSLTIGARISSNTADSDFVNINSAGNVGIGVSPSNATLDVLGNASTVALAARGRSADNLSGIVFRSNNGATEYAYFQGGPTFLATGVNGAERMRIESSGNVGIGTSSPATRLHVAGGSLTMGAFGGEGGEIQLHNTVGGSGVGLDVDGSNNFRVFNVSNTATIFYTNATERARITNDGNFGIGTSSPSARLDVTGGANVTGRFSHPGNTAFGTVIQVKTTGGTDDPMISLENYNGGSPVRYGVICTDNGSLAFMAGGYEASFGTERMRIDSSGIVTMSAYGAGAATFSAAGVISSVSDETWKVKDGVPVNPDSMLKKLEPGYWYYNDEKKETFGADRQLGFYAQNVNAAIGPEAAPEPEEGKPWGYYDRSVLAVVVMSLQKALATIESLEARIATLESKP